jgi:hypothetical protein
MGTLVEPHLQALVAHVAAELAAQGAVAVLLIGSHARGDAYAESDVDIIAIGQDGAWRLERREGYLVSLNRSSAESLRAVLSNPAVAGGLVPGLRGAVLLHDPQGVAAQLRAVARTWSWESINAQCDAWVAEEITGYAEEVHRLVGQLTRRPTMAAVVRNVLAMRMGVILAVHLRLLYDSENRLWDLVNAAMDERWRRAQRAALGMDGESLAETCAAALELYALAAARLEHLLDARQSAVVAHACALAGHALW